MLIYGSRLIGTPILSVQAGGAVGYVASMIVDPDSLKIIGFVIEGGVVGKNSANILDVSSVREYSKLGMVIDEIEELVEPDDVVKISKVLELNFNIVGLKVETRKKSKLGKVMDFTVTSEDFMIQQIVVKRPIVKGFIDPELMIPRKEIVEITDYKIIVKDEEKKIKEVAEKEEFVPNFVNPFRKSGQEFAPADNRNLDDKDTE